MENEKKTLRLIMPQWQGGNNFSYHFGAQLLAWLAPPTDDETIEVPISTDPTNDDNEDGIVAKKQIIEQTQSALNILHERNPDNVVVLGGDCSVELAPFAYLAEKYKEDLAILWIDAHPDIKTADLYPHYHAMILATLLGEGDSDLAQLVPKKVNPKNIVFAGINDDKEKATAVYEKYKFTNVSSEEFSTSSETLINALRATGASRIAVHFDLDVLDLREFRSQGIAKPERYEEYVGKGLKRSSMQSVTRLIQDVSNEFDVVGLGITEHLPWDAFTLSNMLRNLPLLKKH
ncbi:arginase family protein [Cytobacillus gottheilii]|uniref:Arginase family protein n=1 Tax=Cytobacillus gottheilii TaxID=859144 RepID=A0ABX8FHD8_9BACI|nr:arginase family protein [Cytobacillus gottheilii]QVY63444.1 arginase family protein [Cytobacillus gottheilii]